MSHFDRDQATVYQRIAALYTEYARHAAELYTRNLTPSLDVVVKDAMFRRAVEYQRQADINARVARQYMGMSA